MKQDLTVRVELAETFIRFYDGERVHYFAREDWAEEAFWSESKQWWGQNTHRSLSHSCPGLEIHARATWPFEMEIDTYYEVFDQEGIESLYGHINDDLKHAHFKQVTILEPLFDRCLYMEKGQLNLASCFEFQVHYCEDMETEIIETDFPAEFLSTLTGVKFEKADLEEKVLGVYASYGLV